ncbi:hypothetical protein LZ198_39040 [Myxococcus sp. K15C18031901]|uniref:hypothetical protein n=1 Tax=Myxococcus dinghuensis TaxID=2906761 RepID=UPI0020A83011|nr:hypothetical protein [Myxococcus dinghuensis]MCP3104880.1 hypothetical protein [Myxococcus dinghuensis]
MSRVSFITVITRWFALCLSLVGVQALAGHAPVSDGVVLLGTGTSNRYIVVGGSPFYIPPAQWSVYSSATLVSTPQATIDSYEKVPRDGTLMRQYNIPGTVYVVVDRWFWRIPTTTELDYWDGPLGFTPIQDLPNSGWAANFHDYAYKALVQERTGGTTYLWIAGAKYPVTNPSDLAYYGGSGAVKYVPVGTLADYTHVPWCGAVFRERSSSTTYLIGLDLTNPSSPMYKSATSIPEHGAVPDGSLSPFSDHSSLACVW